MYTCKKQGTTRKSDSLQKDIEKLEVKYWSQM